METVETGKSPFILRGIAFTVTVCQGRPFVNRTSFAWKRPWLLKIKLVVLKLAFYAIFACPSKENYFFWRAL